MSLTAVERSSPDSVRRVAATRRGLATHRPRKATASSSNDAIQRRMALQMKTIRLDAYTFALLVLTPFSSSCNSPKNATSPHIAADAATSPAAGQATLLKTEQSSKQNVHCGLQDKAGQLWFGTTGLGVYRYDGKSFTTFTTRDGLNSNCVWAMYQDTSGNIWFGTKDGICCYDGSTFSSIPIPVTDNSIALPNSVWSILQDQSGMLWFSRSDGVYCYDGNVFTRFPQDSNVINDSGLQLRMVEAMLEDKAGNIWFGSWAGEGVCRFDGEAITSFRPNDETGARCISRDREGNLWFASRSPNSVCRYDGKTFTRFAEKTQLGHVTCIVEDKAGRVWLGADGLWCFDGQSLIEYTTKDGLSHEGVWCIVEDLAGNIWAGTRNTGLCRYDGASFTDLSGSWPDR